MLRKHLALLAAAFLSFSVLAFWSMDTGEEYIWIVDADGATRSN